MARRYWDPSEAERSRFLTQNPGDIGRIKEAFSEEVRDTPAPAAAPSPAVTALTGGVSAPESPAISGLKAFSPVSVGASPFAGLGAGGGGETGPMPDATDQLPLPNDFVGGLPLRQNLGTRIYPNESFPLAGLKRAY